MSGVLSGLRVLDLSWGIAGPMTTMLLADHGADVIKIEPPGGDRFRDRGRCALGYTTWQRGKRSAILDLKDAEDLDVFKALAANADILVESYGPGVAARLGVDYETIGALNPRLIYTTIDAYGDTRHRRRPGHDLLVTARMGLHWEHRGWPEASVRHTAKAPNPLADVQIPWESRQGPPREGPIVIGVPTASVGAFFGAISGISAALVAREKTGRGQRVRSSLLQGAAAACQNAWQRVENAELPNYSSWAFSSLAPKGHFQCADGKWVHNWVPNPRFIMGASEGDQINATADLSVHNDPDRFGMGLEEVFVMDHYQPILAERMRKFPAKDWIEAAAIADLPIQEARSPEAALADPLLLADGCVREIDDPRLGRIRQLGTLIDFEKTPCTPGGPAAAPGQHTQEVKAEARRGTPRAAPPQASGRRLSSPLEGVRVLDLGLAIAGPFGCQVLGDFGADVIKVNTFHDSYWHQGPIAATSNRSKRSVCIDLKHPASREVFEALVRTADVVQHNMRYDAAIRLGVDYETLKKIKPDLIYCHTRGHERGPRETQPANEQTAACLAGAQYEDGAMAAGGKPLWTFTKFGDTGTGLLSAIGVMHALYHRERTGDGQFLTTAIVNAQLLNCSYVLARPDGSGFERPRLDRLQYGFSALYGLYETKRRWLAIAVGGDAEWQALVSAMPAGALDDADFATEERRKRHDAKLRARLSSLFLEDAAEAWFRRLDAAGVPCEISDETVSQRAQDDPELNALGLIAHFQHPIAGKFDQVGLFSQLSDTPGVIRHRPLVVGEHTREVLTELGYAAERLAELAAARAIGIWEEGQPMLSGPPRGLTGGRRAAQPGKAAAPQRA
jgi:crotonobetainyl-CoA:carnitine CoA-transferase CaiB-like acyl-CoA transferase